MVAVDGIRDGTALRGASGNDRAHSRDRAARLRKVAVSKDHFGGSEPRRAAPGSLDQTRAGLGRLDAATRPVAGRIANAASLIGNAAGLIGNASGFIAAVDDSIAVPACNVTTCTKS